MEQQLRNKFDHLTGSSGLQNPEWAQLELLQRETDRIMATKQRVRESADEDRAVYRHWVRSRSSNGGPR